MDEPKKAERRASPRVPQSSLLHSLKRGSEILSQEKITGVLRDISGTGISFLSDGDYAAGDTLDLQIDLPGSQHQVLVQVVRVETLGDSKVIGAYFVNMSSEHEKALLASLFSSP